MLEYRYDTQLLIDGHDLDEDKVYDYFVDHFEGDCLIAVGDEDMIKMEANLKDDLGIDSLAAVELSLELETEFDVRIEDEELAKLVTVADIVSLLESKA